MNSFRFPKESIANINADLFTLLEEKTSNHFSDRYVNIITLNNGVYDPNNYFERGLSFFKEGNKLICDCSMVEVDINSVMYDQLARGRVIFDLIYDDNNKVIDFKYFGGECKDRYEDGFCFSHVHIRDILLILAKYWVEIFEYTPEPSC